MAGEGAGRPERCPKERPKERPTRRAKGRPTRGALFLAFLKIGLLGFGGVAPYARHVLVTERRFLDDRAFAETLGLASTLPGANVVNVSVILGDRFYGPLGSAIALAGLIGAPLGVLLCVALVYSAFAHQPDVQAALLGVAAAAAGIVLGTALKILQRLKGGLVTYGIAGAVALAAGLQVPMALILALAIPAAVVALRPNGSA